MTKMSIDKISQRILVIEKILIRQKHVNKKTPI